MMTVDGTIHLISERCPRRSQLSSKEYAVDIKAPAEGDIELISKFRSVVGAN